MARSLPNTKALVASFQDAISLAFTRRGYAAAQGVVASSTVDKQGGPTSQVEVIKEESGASSSWTPDPVTGYYKPSNRAAEVDAVELREVAQNHKIKPH